MNLLLQRYMNRVVCKKCKISQSPRRTLCINYRTRGCRNSLRPRRASR